MKSFFSEHTVKARKERPCFFCGEPIVKGTRYLHRSGLGLNDYFTMSMHPECVAATKDWTDGDYDTFTQGTLTRVRDAG